MRYEVEPENPVSPAELRGETGRLPLGQTLSVEVGEPISTLESSDPGVRLDLALAADQRLRAEREAWFTHKLERLQRLNTLARRGAVTAGLLEIGIYLIVGTTGSLAGDKAASDLTTVLGVVWLGLLAICGGAALYAGWMRPRILNQARRERVELPALDEVATDARWQAEPVEGNHDPELAQLAQAVNDSCSTVNTLSGYCLRAGGVVAVSGALMVIALGAISLEARLGRPISSLAQLLSIGYCITIPVATIALIVLPICAWICAFMGYRRKVLLRKAARLGYRLYRVAPTEGDAGQEQLEPELIMASGQ